MTSQSNWFKNLRYLLVFSSLLTITACGGEFSYKRGATGADYQNLKKDCEQRGQTEAEIDQCLQKQGWVVVSPEKSLIGRHAGTISPNNVVDARIPKAETLTDPLEIVEIGSWWKLGASPETLLKQGEECAETLGEGHVPSANMSVVTSGLLSCMGEKGWSALKR